VLTGAPPFQRLEQRGHIDHPDQVIAIKQPAAEQA